MVKRCHAVTAMGETFVFVNGDVVSDDASEPEMDALTAAFSLTNVA